MLRKLLAGLGALSLALVPIFVTYWLNRSKPDVRYTLSEPIPVSFLGATTFENVQQLEVRNVGNAEAERIVVKIEGQLTSYEIEKHISSDVVEVFDQQQPVEFIYPELPPQGGFKLVFKSPDTVDKNNVRVMHSRGNATEALSAEKEFSNLVATGISVAILVGYLLIIAYMVGTSLRDSWKLRATHKHPDQVLSLRKPWYIPETTWRNLHVDVIKRRLEAHYSVYGEDLENSAAYTFLRAKKPDHLDDADWSEIIILAVGRLSKICSEMVSSHSESNVMAFLRSERPKHYPADKWDDLEKRANERFASLRKQVLFTSERVLRALEEEKPEEVSGASWSELTKYLQDQYYEMILQNLRMSDSPLDLLAQRDLRVLDEKRREDLKQWAFGKVKYNELVRLLRSLLGKEGIGTEKPDPLSNWEWEQLKELEDRVAVLREVEAMKKEIQRESSGLATERSEVSLLRQKIERQLDIVNSLLDDPTVIDRIESYDDTFAPGNLDNLRKVAQILQERVRS